MSNVKTPFIKRWWSLIILLFALPLFQNCGSVDSGVEAELASYEKQVADSLPFAFEANIDHMGYMSCESDSLAVSRTHFNFKAGAFEGGSGVQIRDKFREAVAGYDKSTSLSMLAASTRNRGAGVMMSVRSASELRAPLGIAENTGANDFTHTTSPLSWDLGNNITLTARNIAEHLWDSFLKVNFFPMLPTQNKQRYFEGEIKFKGSDAAYGIQNSIRSALESDSYLTFTFASQVLGEEAPGTFALSPRTLDPKNEAAKTSVWGKGYQFSFAQYDGSRQSSPRSAVVGVRGFALEDGSSLAGDEEWDCPADEKYIIVRAADALRRYDAAPAFNGDGPNEPWQTATEDYGVDADGNPHTPPPGYSTAYVDGGPNRGGYYMQIKTYKVGHDSFDHDGKPETAKKVQYRVDEEEFTRHKVICPTVPDFPNITNANDVAAWRRARKLLPISDWFIYRGPRYNCIVPKKDDNACYGILNILQQAGYSNARIKYFPDEDSPTERIMEKVTAGPDATDPPRETGRDCNSFAAGAEGGLACPEVFSVCYRKK